MRYWTTIAATAGVIIGLALPAGAEVKDVTGELISIMCVAKNGDSGRGDAHSACALTCVKEGYPLAVITSEGTIYKLKGSLTADHNAALQKLIARTVVATGDVAQEGESQTLDASAVVLAGK